MNFYTNVLQYGGKILIRGIKDGKSFAKRVNYKPSFYIKSKKDNTTFTTLQNEPVEEIQLPSIDKARNLLKQYKNSSNVKLYGMDRFLYQFISDEYKDDIEWNKDYIKIYTLDIETECENGFPDINKANEKLICVTIKNHQNKKIITWGVGNFISKDLNVTYIKCKDEVDLLTNILEFWSKNPPDVVTGWNVKFFDMPYLVNRIRVVIGDDVLKQLSPWGKVVSDNIILAGRSHLVYNFLGITTLDYLDLYRRFIPVKRENYTLGYIGKTEVDEEKTENPYETFREFYQKDYQRFVEYNIQDVNLVDKLEDKLGLIQLTFTMAYDAKVNYIDVYSQVRMWDVIIYNFLRKENKVIPPRVEGKKDKEIEGAYVKEPDLGKHDWIVSFDINSLYPHLIMQYNISPETIRGMHREGISVRNFLDEKVDTKYYKDNNITICPNGAVFSREKQGFLAKLMDKMYKSRIEFKEGELKAKREYDKTNDDLYKKEAARCFNIQWAKKISLNSAYGAIGNQYFRFFDERQAEAITTSGQLTIRWIEKKLNILLNSILKTDNKDYIIASDTDSVYVKMSDLVEKVCKDKDNNKILNFLDKVVEQKLQPFIDKCFKELGNYTNAFQQRLEMKREIIADKGIWVAKKRYMLNVLDEEGIRYRKPKLKIMGVEAVKSSTPQVCREEIRKAIDIILTGTQEDLISFVSDFREKFFSYIPEKISSPRSCNFLTKYSSSKDIFKIRTPIHTKGALVYNQKLKDLKLENRFPFIQNGDKIKYILLKIPNPMKCNVVSFITSLPKQFNLKDYIDYEMQFEKTFTDPLRIVLKVVNWDYEKKASLESFI